MTRSRTGTRQGIQSKLNLFVIFWVHDGCLVAEFASLLWKIQTILRRYFWSISDQAWCFCPFCACACVHALPVDVITSTLRSKQIMTISRQVAHSPRLLHTSLAPMQISFSLMVQQQADGLHRPPRRFWHKDTTPFITLNTLWLHRSARLFVAKKIIIKKS